MGGGISAVIGGLALLGFLAFLAGIGLVVVAASQGRPVRGGLLLAAIGLVTGVLLSVVSQGIIVVPPQEVAVVFQTLSGELEERPRGPGTHIIIPVLQEATTYPIFRQEYTMSGVEEEGLRRGDDAIEARTIDGQSVRIDVTVFFRIIPDQANLIHVNWQERYRDEFVRPTIRGLVRDQVALFQAEAIYGESRALLEERAESAMRASFEPEGIELIDFLIRQIDFTDDFSASIEQKEIEEQRLQRAETEAQRRETEAQGLANAAIEAARGEAEAIRVRAIAQAEALRVVSEQIAANPLLIQYEYIRNLSDNINMALIPSNSPFLFDFDSISNLPEADAGFEAPEIPASEPVTEPETEENGN